MAWLAHASFNWLILAILLPLFQCLQYEQVMNWAAFDMPFCQ
jgi:hypothetical protein